MTVVTHPCKSTFLRKDCLTISYATNSKQIRSTINLIPKIINTSSVLTLPKRDIILILPMEKERSQGNNVAALKIKQ